MRKCLIIIFYFVFSNISFSQCWKEISAGSAGISVGIKADGGLWAWGNWVGSNIPQQVGNDYDWASVAAGNGCYFAIKQNGTLWGYGSNSSGQLGDGTYIDKTVLSQIGTASNWKQIDPGLSHILAVKTDGTLWSWGANNYGQLGYGLVSAPTNLPSQVGTYNHWVSVSTGVAHSSAIAQGQQLYTWGRNTFGQLGDGNNNDIYTPTYVASFKFADCGNNNTNGLKNYNVVESSGENDDGECGLGTIPMVNSFTYTASNILKLSSAAHNLAIKTDGSLWAWGANYLAQCGNGTMTNILFPIQIGSTTDWLKVSAGWGYSLAIKTDGSLWAWGENSFGQIGTQNTSPYVTQPILISSCDTTTNLSTYENRDFEIKVYPNPAYQFLNISSDNRDYIDRMSILNIVGEEVKILNQEFERIDISNLTKGLYLLKVQTAKNKIHLIKFFKE